MKIDRANRNYLVVFCIAIPVQLIVFKWLYPFADFFTDSFSYIYAAAHHMDVNMWPIGYSKFLLWFHAITSSDTAVVAFQYLLVELSALYFFITLRSFIPISGIVANVLFCFLFLNPLLLYLCNYISSDAIFLALSLLWLTELLWTMVRPTKRHLLFQAVLLVLAFTVRYNALYYPLITGFALIASPQKNGRKWAWFFFTLALVGSFVLFTRQKMAETTGVRQFSSFSGWQLANNALYMYTDIQVDTNALPDEMRPLDRYVRQYFSKVDPEQRDMGPRDGAWYIKVPWSPLHVYASEYQYKHHIDMNLVAFSQVAPLLSRYSGSLIRSHPGAYTTHFILPNAGVYFFPPLEKLEVYNMGKDTVREGAREWFGYRSIQVKSFDPEFQGHLLGSYPIFFLLFNVAMAAALVTFFVRGWHRSVNGSYRLAVLLLGFYWLVNMGFSILASPVVFRYQVLPMIVCLVTGLAVAERLLAEMEKQKAPSSVVPQ
jgi:hypothetical protein